MAMQNRRSSSRGIWRLTSVPVILSALAVGVIVVTFFLNRTVCYVEAAVAAVAAIPVCRRLRRTQKSIHRYLRRVAAALDPQEQAALTECPLPVLVASEQGEIVWYSERFRREVLHGNDLYGEPLTAVTGGWHPERDPSRQVADVTVDEEQYTVFWQWLRGRDTRLAVGYYVENTRLKAVAKEYELSRPVVMLLYIDNLDELTQDMRESERAQWAGRVEGVLEDWVSAFGAGLLRKVSAERFLLLVEQRHLQQMIDRKFDVLDRVRGIARENGATPTLSIGVGQGATMRESEELARQALDMALGRGGDQAAVRNAAGYDFYGGVSKGVEKRTRVRPRVVASALGELIRNADQVITVGHRFSDLDCVGASVALAAAARWFGKPAWVALDREQTLAGELVARLDEAGRGDLFLTPSQAVDRVTDNTLLIITDTHHPGMIDVPALYGMTTNVAVIDHHRKMVEHIGNTVLFYHEPYASSASELVTELVPYWGAGVLSRLDAEALLAGIVLDTRGFAVKTGVRTFEAAAWLRGVGADTTEVKRWFAGGISLYRTKTALMSRAEMEGRTAIACCDETVAAGAEGQLRIAAAQAADELLYIQGVDASFVLFEDGGAVNISARSLGAFNVQLTMEALGGGGHLTMAGTQLAGVTMDEARQRLVAAIGSQRGEEAPTP